MVFFRDKNETQLTALVKKLVNRVTNVEQYGEVKYYSDLYCVFLINKLQFFMTHNLKKLIYFISF